MPRPTSMLIIDQGGVDTCSERISEKKNCCKMHLSGIVYMVEVKIQPILCLFSL